MHQSDAEPKQESEFIPPQALKRAELRKVLGLLKEQGISEAEAYQRLRGDPRLRRVLEELNQKPG